MSSVVDPQRTNWQSVRARVAYGASSLLALTRLTGKYVQEGAVFLVIMRRSAGDWVDENGAIRPLPEPVKWSSINSVAAELGRPPETARRHINWLKDKGLVEQRDQGVAISTREPAVAQVMAYLQGRHDAFLRFCKALDEAADMPPQPPAAPSPAPVRLVLEAALDVDLVPFEFNRDLLATLESTIVYSALAHYGTKKIQDDPCLSQRYRFENTPDDMREAMSLKAISEEFSLPYATVWRHAQNLHEIGLISRRGRSQWVVLANDLYQKDLFEASKRYFDYLRAKIRSLHASGLSLVS